MAWKLTDKTLRDIADLAKSHNHAGVNTVTHRLAGAVIKLLDERQRLTGVVRESRDGQDVTQWPDKHSSDDCFVLAVKIPADAWPELQTVAVAIDQPVSEVIALTTLVGQEYRIHQQRQGCKR